MTKLFGVLGDPNHINHYQLNHIIGIDNNANLDVTHTAHQVSITM